MSRWDYPNQVRIILQNKVSRSLFDKINDLLVICDEGRFSPVAYEKRNIVIDEMFKILKQIEKEKKTGRKEERKGEKKPRMSDKF